MLHFLATVNALMCAVNVGFYVHNPSPLSAGAAVLCGFVALMMIALAVTR